MSVFGEAINSFRGIAGKYYSSGPAMRARAVASRLAYAPKLGAIGAAGGAIVGAGAGGRDHRLSGAMAGAGLGSLAGVSLRAAAGARGTMLGSGASQRLLGGSTRGRANPIGPRGPFGMGGPDRLRLGPGGRGPGIESRNIWGPTFITQPATKLM